MIASARIDAIAGAMVAAAEALDATPHELLAASADLALKAHAMTLRCESVNVIHLRGRVDAPGRASRQLPITGTNGSRFSFAPVLSPTTTNTEAPQTGDQPSSTGPRE